MIFDKQSDRGEVYGWGYNDKYQLGLRHRYNQERPQLIKSLLHEKIIQVACGQQHSLALTNDGKVYSWGLGVFGQLGHSRLSDEASPTLIQHLEGYRIVQVACGAHHSLVRDGIELSTFLIHCFFCCIIISQTNQTLLTH